MDVPLESNAQIVEKTVRPQRILNIEQDVLDFVEEYPRTNRRSLDSSLAHTRFKYIRMTSRGFKRYCLVPVPLRNWIFRLVVAKEGFL